MADIKANPTMGLRPESPTPDNSAPLLKRVSSIYYLMWFKTNQAKIQALLDSGREVNAMTPAYAARLSLKI